MKRYITILTLFVVICFFILPTDSFALSKKPKPVVVYEQIFVNKNSKDQTVTFQINTSYYKNIFRMDVINGPKGMKEYVLQPCH